MTNLASKKKRLLQMGIATILYEHDSTPLPPPLFPWVALPVHNPTTPGALAPFATAHCLSHWVKHTIHDRSATTKAWHTSTIRRQLLTRKRDNLFFEDWAQNGAFFFSVPFLFFPTTSRMHLTLLSLIPNSLANECKGPTELTFPQSV